MSSTRQIEGKAQNPHRTKRPVRPFSILLHFPSPALHNNLSSRATPSTRLPFVLHLCTFLHLSQASRPYLRCHNHVRFRWLHRPRRLCPPRRFHGKSSMLSHSLLQMLALLFERCAKLSKRHRCSAAKNRLATSRILSSAVKFSLWITSCSIESATPNAPKSIARG